MLIHVHVHVNVNLNVLRITYTRCHHQQSIHQPAKYQIAMYQR